MNYWKKFLGLSLVGALLTGALAGCEKPAPGPDDISYRTTGIARDAALLTVDGVEIPTEEYLYMLVGSISGQLQNGGLADEAAWTGEIEGVAAADYLKNDALQGVKTYAVIRAKAAAEGIAVTAEQQAEIDTQMTQVTETLAKQGLTLQQSLDTSCLSEAGFRSLNTVYYLAQGLQEKLFPMEPTAAPTSADLQPFLDEQGIYNCKHILFGTQTRNADQSTTEFSDAKKAEVKAEAEAALARIKAAVDPAALFDEIMNQRSDDGRGADGALAAPEGYLTSQGQMAPEFEAGALALEIGGISELVKTDFGYHIILRLDAENDQTRQFYTQMKDQEAQQNQGTQMSEQLDKWMGETKVELKPTYDGIKPKEFYDKIQEVIAERKAIVDAAAAATASPAPEASPITSPVSTGESQPTPSTKPAE